MTLTDLSRAGSHEAGSAMRGPRPPRIRSRSGTRSRRSLVGDVGVAVVTALILLPFLFTVVTALRPSADVAANPLGLPTRVTLENFVVAAASMDYLTSVANSLVILLGSLAGSIVLGALAAYPLSRISRGWTTGVYRLFVAGATVPVFVIIAPLYLLERDLGLLNTHVGVVLAYSALNLPVAVFFYTSFFRQIPVELEEAAAIDGAGPVRTFFVILFPLLRPVTATLATFLTLAVWNDLVIPLVFLHDPSHATVMVNAYSLVGTYGTDPTVLFPAALLGVAPLLVVFVLLQRHVVAGLTAGAVKS